MAVFGPSRDEISRTVLFKTIRLESVTRAFCPFDSRRDPDPKYFREVLENSLDPQGLAKFCDDFLKLPSYNKKRHKDKVPCLVGDVNSDRTSLFFPILGLIHHGNVATVTKQRAFNKSVITPFTEVIFIDEATETTLDIDNWKMSLGVSKTAINI